MGLTGGVALHVNDTFGVLSDLPGVEGPNPDRDFHGPRHGCGV